MSENDATSEIARGLARKLTVARDALRIAGVDFNRLWDEGDESGCPYYRSFYRGGEGKCDRGCWSEPSCITNEPQGGWPLARFRLEGGITS